jgi:hypothetical protein
MKCENNKLFFRLEVDDETDKFLGEECAAMNMSLSSYMEYLISHMRKAKQSPPSGDATDAGIANCSLRQIDSPDIPANAMEEQVANSHPITDDNAMQKAETKTTPDCAVEATQGKEGKGPCHAIAYDRENMRWFLGPYSCRVQLTPCLGSSDFTSNLNALTVTVFNNDPDRTLPNGGKMRTFSYDFSSTLFPKASTPKYAMDYDGAVANLHSNKGRVESLMGCTFDFSELINMDVIRREFTRRAEGKVSGDSALEF